MKVDHLASNVNRDRLRILRDLQSQRAIERDHRIGVLHWERDMVKAANVVPGLRRGSLRAGCNHSSDECTSLHA